MRVRNVLILCLLSMVGCGLATSNEERLDRAEAAFEEGAYRAAMIDARDVLRREPDNVRGRLLLGRVSLAVGDVAAAEKELRRAVDLGTPLEHVILDLGISVLRQGKYQDLLDEFPAEPAITAAEQVQWMLVRADALLGLGQIESARDVYSAAISSEPDNVLAKMGVVATYQAEQNLLQARITLDEVLAAHPEAPEPWLVSGEIDLRLQRYEEAATSFGRALELLDSAGSSATAARALAGLAAAQLSLQHTDAARETVSRLEALAPGSVSALQLSASLAYGDEDLDAAQQKLQLILQQAPDNTAAQMLLGVVHLESGNLAQAEMYLSSVVAGAPENIEARTLLAQTRLQLQRFDQARETLAPMLSEHNPDSRMLAVAALLDIETGNVDRGVEYLEQSVAASPNNAELKLQLAAAYVSAGRIAEAQALLDSVEPGAVDNDEYRRGLLQALVKFHEGAVDEAIASGQETAHRFPGRSEANIMIGYFHLSRREFEAARKYFELGASQTGGRAMAQRYLGAIDMAEGKLDTAEERYAAILKMQPHATWAMVAMAGIASEREDKVNTIRWLERARESDPADVASRALLARIYLGEQKFKEAETVSREAIAISPDNASLHNMLGVSLLRQRHFEDAAKNFATAIEIDESDAEYHRNLAAAKTAVEDTAGATTALQNAWDRDIADVPTAGILIASRIKAGEYPEALAMVSSLQQRYPESPLAVAYEGEVYLAAGNAQKAIDAYERALAMGPNRKLVFRAYRVLQDLGAEQPLKPLLDYLDARPSDNVVRMVLARGYQSTSDYAAAISEYEVVINDEPDNAIALNNLAWLYHQTGNSKAVAAARKAYALNPDEANIADTLGWILIETGELSEGVEIIREALEPGGDAEHHYHLAAGLAKLGERDAARQTLEELLRSDQSFASRADAESLLKSL